MTMLFILNDPPYGTERTYNGLRLVLNMFKLSADSDVNVFLMGDAVMTAKTGQQTPNGYYNLERMLQGIVKRGGHVFLCGTCMDARGLKDAEIIEGCQRSTLDELTELTVSAEKVLVF